ncbi:hypothetical protein CFAEC_06510 [Corynebacterium faecale]|nr:hypothetical protein CFAEC_06510 [Corynebacterium faecale]
MQIHPVQYIHQNTEELAGRNAYLSTQFAGDGIRKISNEMIVQEVSTVEISDFTPHRHQLAMVETLQPNLWQSGIVPFGVTGDPVLPLSASTSRGSGPTGQTTR